MKNGLYAKTKIPITIGITIFLLALAGGAIFSLSQNSSDSTSITSQAPSTLSKPSLSQSAASPSPTTQAKESFQKGIEQFSQKDYQQSVEHFSDAIEASPENPDYYAYKSSAQYNLGQKDEAIATVQEGLQNNPDNELLKSKLDVLQKDSFSNSDQEATRQ